MTLRLRIISHQAAEAEAVKTVEQGGITIGRAPDNDWVLPDPDRHLSKRHCQIAFEGGDYILTDTSTNGVYLNESVEPLGRGSRSSLQDGDRLTLGDYRIEVRLASESRAPDETMAPPDPGSFTALLSGGAPAADDRDPFGIDRDRAGAPPADPLADPLAGPPAGSPFADWPASGAGAPSGASIPDDDDLLGGDPLGGDPLGSAPFDDGLFGDGGRRDEGWEMDPQPDHAPSEQAFFHPPDIAPSPDSPPAAASNLIPEDWDLEDDFDAPMQPSGAVPEAPPPQEPGIDAVRPEPGPEPQPAPPVGTGAVGPGAVDSGAVGTGVADVSAFRAFLAGAGLDAATVSEENAAELMHAAGKTFRVMVEGLREILVARSTVKNEFRIERTMIRSAGNNPLKFSASADEALMAMLCRIGPGYLPAVDAVQEGFKDIKAHQLAMMAGMQVALAALLKRFHPEGLKQRLAKGSVLDGILPGARKSRYWELYEAFYREIAGEAEQDFQGLFGRAFARAYEEQVKNL